MTMIANRYELVKKLGAGGMGAVYLAHDKLRNQHVALKQVLTSDDEQRLAITREFRTLSTLRHPNIVGVIEYGIHDHQPYFTMEYLPDARPFDQNMEGLVQILQALGYLHRRGILHRDLKPGNVLVTSGGTVKVLDFGLALDKAAREMPTEMSGTLAYMAPELFMEEAPSVGSDLWAVGIMACEVLVNRHPFHSSPSIPGLINAIMTAAPDLTGIDEKLVPVILRLLSKDPADRYPSAFAVIQEVCVAAGIELPPESGAHRESFLQAAAFVGRDDEYRRLIDALHVVTAGKGQLWLIGGEAGAGKSRLLDEVRTRALVDGFTVLQGQGVEGGGLPYQLWREPARKLVLGAPMDDLTASVLKEIVHDMATLLGRDVPDISPLDPSANRDRLMTALLERLRSLNAPVLLILEDLHWTNESLDLLKRLWPYLETMPVMIVGSYRNDERPTLPDELPAANRLKLERLSPHAVAALSASMIGAENTTPQLVERLASETEGNALFMVEVVRALAEEAGSLHDIGYMTLPDKILVGGIVTVLRRRLSKVPALDTLKLAAVIGRVVDLEVLKAAGVENIDDWLQTCADAVVLEPYQGEWRFSHDRLREVLLHDLQPDELAALHEKAARAIETVHLDDVDYAEALAHHWRIAGNPEREVKYILDAAVHLSKINADYERAETLLKRGLDLNIPSNRAKMFHWMGFTAEKLGDYKTALQHYQDALLNAPDPKVKATTLNRMAVIRWMQGSIAEARDYIQQSQAVAEAHGDQLNVARNLNMLANLKLNEGDYQAAQNYYAECLRLWREYGGDDSGIAIYLSNIGVTLHYQGEHKASIAHFEESLQIQRKIGDRAGISASLNNLGYLTQYQGDYEAALKYYEESLHMRHEIRDREGIATSFSNLGFVEDVRGNLDAARTHYEESLVLIREMGNPGMLVSATMGLAVVLMQCGERDAAYPVLIESLTTARRMDTVPMMLSALLGAAYWTEKVEWIGLMQEQGDADIKDDARLKRLSYKLRAELGDDVFNAAVEHGKRQDVRMVIDKLLGELL